MIRYSIESVAQAKALRHLLEVAEPILFDALLRVDGKGITITGSSADQRVYIRFNWAIPCELKHPVVAFVVELKELLAPFKDLQPTSTFYFERPGENSIGMRIYTETEDGNNAIYPLHELASPTGWSSPPLECRCSDAPATDSYVTHCCDVGFLTATNLYQMKNIEAMIKRFQREGALTIAVEESAGLLASSGEDRESFIRTVTKTKSTSYQLKHIQGLMRLSLLAPVCSINTSNGHGPFILQVVAAVEGAQILAQVRTAACDVQPMVGGASGADAKKKKKKKEPVKKRKIATAAAKPAAAVTINRKSKKRDLVV